MSGPFKLKYKNSTFPFKGSIDPSEIVSAAESAYTAPEETSVAAGLVEGIAAGYSGAPERTEEQKQAAKDKRKELVEKTKAWWKEQKEKLKKSKRNPNEGSYPSTGKFANDMNRNGIPDYLEKP